MDVFEAFKNLQKQSWANFAPIEMITMIAAPRLVKFAGVKGGQKVLDRMRDGRGGGDRRAAGGEGVGARSDS
jgi:hypothetical protein